MAVWTQDCTSHHPDLGAFEKTLEGQFLILSNWYRLLPQTDSGKFARHVGSYYRQKLTDIHNQPGAWWSRGTRGTLRGSWSMAALAVNRSCWMLDGLQTVLGSRDRGKTLFKMCSFSDLFLKRFKTWRLWCNKLPLSSASNVRLRSSLGRMARKTAVALISAYCLRWPYSWDVFFVEFAGPRSIANLESRKDMFERILKNNRLDKNQKMEIDFNN